MQISKLLRELILQVLITSGNNMYVSGDGC